jgi:hypothetical protein
MRRIDLIYTGISYIFVVDLIDLGTVRVKNVSVNVDRCEGKVTFSKTICRIFSANFSQLLQLLYSDHSPHLLTNLFCTEVITVQ